MRLTAKTFALAILALPLPLMTFGQRPVKPITVCEALANYKKLSGKAVAIVGRLDCTDNIIDTHCYLTEDRCPQLFVSNGETWSNRIWVQWKFERPYSEQASVTVDEAALKEKLTAVRASTALGTHKVMQWKKINGVAEPAGWADEPDTWGVGYGRIIKGRPVNFFGAPVGLLTRSSDIRHVKAEESGVPTNN